MKQEEENNKKQQLDMNDPKKSFSAYRVVKITLTAVYLPGWNKSSSIRPYFKLFGYNVSEKAQLLYTSEVSTVKDTAEYTCWDAALFAISKSTVLNKFRVEIFDKQVSLMSKWVAKADSVLAGPVDLTMQSMVAGAATKLGGVKEKMQICVDNFEML